MSNVMNDDFLGLLIYGINYSVISNSQPVQLFSALKFQRLPRKRVICQEFQTFYYAANHGLGRDRKSLSTEGLVMTLYEAILLQPPFQLW